jgi:hypothetical protein
MRILKICFKDNKCLNSTVTAAFKKAMNHDDKISNLLNCFLDYKLKQGFKTLT